MIRNPPPRGFTIVELMIVVSIIGILAGIALPKFADMVRKAQEGASLGNLGAIRSALNIYNAGNDGIYPQSLGFLYGYGYLQRANTPTGLPMINHAALSRRKFFEYKCQ